MMARFMQVKPGTTQVKLPTGRTLQQLIPGEIVVAVHENESMPLDPEELLRDYDIFIRGGEPHDPVVVNIEDGDTWTHDEYEAMKPNAPLFYSVHITATLHGLDMPTGI